VRKFIFLEGVDGSGKTTKAKQLLNIKDNPFVYFRSNYQNGSMFAEEPINLEESLKHDWRILEDFINQIWLNKETILVDRGFISSIVYGDVFRGNKDVWKYYLPYLKMFEDKSEFWFFIREDEGMTEEEIQINEMYKKLVLQMSNKNDFPKLVIKTFYRTKDNKFITKDFLNVQDEVDLGHLDVDYYNKKIEEVLQYKVYVDNFKDCIISDLDGTIVKEGYPNTTELIPLKDNIKFINTLPQSLVIVITGRENYIPRESDIRDLGIDKRVFVIGNNKNYGLSSRVLKEYCLKNFNNHFEYLYLDDRKDVIESLFTEYRQNNQFDGYIANGGLK